MSQFAEHATGLRTAVEMNEFTHIRDRTPTNSGHGYGENGIGGQFEEEKTRSRIEHEVILVPRMSQNTPRN